MERKEDAVYVSARKLKCFRLLSDRDLRTLLGYGRYVVYRKKRSIYYQSEPAREALLIIAGRVTHLKYRVDDSCLVVGQAEQGDWIGIPEVLLSSIYLTDAVAEENTNTLVFSVNALEEAMKISAMKDFFLEYLAKSLYLLYSQIELNQPRPRIINYVLTHARKSDEGSAYLATTQEDIAQAVGATRETVNKHMNGLQADGLIQIQRGGIGIPDFEALEMITLD